MAGTPALSDAPHGLGDGSRPGLHGSIGPFQMALYGLGNMLGSGVSGLIGQATVLLLLLVFAFLNGARLAGIFVLYAAVAAEN
jgi:amino acid transporter